MKARSLIAIAIIAYIITASAAREAEAETFQPYIEIGKLVNESNASIGAIGVTYRDKWQLSKMFIGEGDTQYGRHKSTRAYTIDRLITPGWFNNKFFMVLGVAKVERSFLVDPYNYHVGAGWKNENWRVYYHHLSSGDINVQNTGIDMLTWRIDL